MCPTGLWVKALVSTPTSPRSAPSVHAEGVTEGASGLQQRRRVPYQGRSWPRIKCWVLTACACAWVDTGVQEQERRVRDIAQGQRGVRGSRHRVHPNCGWAGHLLAWRQVGLQPQPVSRQLRTPQVARAHAHRVVNVHESSLRVLRQLGGRTDRHSRWRTLPRCRYPIALCTGARHPKTRPTGRPRRR